MNKNPNSIDIGNRIKFKRKELGLTQTDIYHNCGISSGTLSKIENGITTPSIILFYKISQILQCDMEWLITGKSSESQNAITHPTDIINEYHKLSKEDEQLLNMFHELPPKKRHDCLVYLQGYIDCAKNKDSSIQQKKVSGK